MKIVLIQKEEKNVFGGISVFDKKLALYLTKQGHEVSILQFVQGNKRKNEGNIYPIPFYFEGSNMFFILLPSEKTIPLITKHLKDIKPDIVYTCIGISPWDFFLPSICHHLRIPLAAVWHTDIKSSFRYFFLLSSLLAVYLPFCLQLDKLHVLSPHVKKFYTENGVDDDKIAIIPNGVNPSVYSPGPSQFATKHNIEQGILFLGRLSIQKNPEILIKSFLSLTLPKTTKLVIVGSGKKEKELKETYKRNKRIIFTGSIRDEQEKVDIMRSCQLFVLPSQFEGMPLALLEAMSCGLTCITTDVASNKEVMQDVGIVIPTRQMKKELPRVLKECLNHPKRYKILGEKARKKILEQFTEEKTLGELETTLHKTALQYKRRPKKTSFLSVFS